MRILIPKKFLLLTLIQFFLSSLCAAQTGTSNNDDERADGRYLLDLTYTAINNSGADIDVFAPGFTWLVSKEVRLGVSTTYLKIDPGNKPTGGETSRGLGDSLVSFQYDWDKRLSTNP